jgi:DNA-binding beta-propeller fold protein YncE
MGKWIPFLAAVCFVFTGCSDEKVAAPVGGEMEGQAVGTSSSMEPASGRVVVANRGSGTISVIDSRTDGVVGTYDLPADAGEPAPEPMYVVYTSTHHRVFVGDRANNRVAAFDAASFTMDGTVAAGNGVFHMWANPQGSQLWVNNDIDKTTTVIDPANLTVITTVATPPDLVAMGGKPHDVILGPMGEFAYVTVLGVMGDNDYVVQYDTGSFEETGRAPVGKDPHVSLARQHDRLYVPCQNSNVVIVLNRFTMEEITRIDVPGAHGAGMTMNGRYFYTANLTGGGANALYTIDTRQNDLVGDPVDSPYEVPHNIALNPSGTKLYLTHSGASDKVTIYEIGGGSPVPEYTSEVTVGLNPFGLAYVI